MNSTDQNEQTAATADVERLVKRPHTQRNLTMNLALWSAKTGLDAQNTQMAIIANNLANANTTGFKSQRAAFQDLMYQNIRQVGAQSTQNTRVLDRPHPRHGRAHRRHRERTTRRAASPTPTARWTCRSRAADSSRSRCPTARSPIPATDRFSLDNQGNVVTASGYPLQPAITIPVGHPVDHRSAPTARSPRVSATKQVHPDRPGSARRLRQRAGPAEHRQQPGGRVGRERLAADRHARHSTDSAPCSRARSRPRTSTRSPSSST